MSSNPARKMQRRKQRSAQLRAQKVARQALSSMFAMETTFWDALNDLPFWVRAWIGLKLTLGAMQPCMHTQKGS